MERNSRLERFSLNTTNIAMPIAESTCINLNGSKLDKSRNVRGDLYGAPSGFHTSDAIAHKKYTNGPSESPLNGYSQHNHSLDNGSKQYSTGQLVNSKIDPRIYTDVQSKGLFSRIVKYHEEGTRVNRSLSTSSAHAKPGHLPNVNLKKVELPYSTKSRNLSITRIPPPEKSLFYGNTLPGILRSSSIVGMQKSDDEISSENRPILHPPQAKSDLAPTRSVLDVLKEISRKRINSDQLDPQNNIKKYCNRSVNEPENKFVSSQQNKRQRENFNLSQNEQHGMPLMAAQNSPEQMAKKRLCSYNNEISSSLSSSQLYATKRKLCESKNKERNADSTSSSDETSFGTKPKQLVQLQKELSHTEQQSSSTHTNPNNFNKITNIAKNDSVNRTLNHVISENGCSTSTKTTSGEEATNSFQQPQSVSKKKITLFNKDYDACESSPFEVHPLLTNKNDILDGTGYFKIPFVKPKADISVAKNPMIERTQKSKLALMLSALRGDLYDDDDDQWCTKGDLSGTNSSIEKENATSTLKETSSNNHSTETIKANTETIDAQSKNIGQISSNAQSFATATISTNSISSTSNTVKSSQETITVSNNEYSSSPKDANLNVPLHPSPLVGIKLKPNSDINSNSSKENTTTSKVPVSENSPIVTTTPATTKTITSFTLSTGNNTEATKATTTLKSPSAFEKCNTINSASTCFTNIPVENGQSIQTSSAPQSSTDSRSSIAFLTSTSVSSTMISSGKDNIIKTSTAPTINSSADSLPKTSNSFNFGNLPASSSVISNTFSSPSFTFGMKPSAAAPPFSFSANAPQVSSGFAFGAPTSNSIASTENKSAPSGNATTTSSKFTFGEIAQSTTTTSTTSISNNNAFGFSFASTNNVQPVSAITSKKDAPAPFAFGTNSNSTTGVVSPIKPGGFSMGNTSFASATNSKSNSSNLFNPPSTQTDAIKPVFSFGANSTSSNASQNVATTKPMFEAPVISASSSTTTNSNIFGSAVGWQNKTFTFGSSNNSDTTNQTTNMLQQSAKQNSGGFSFSALANTVSSTATSNRPPVFSFGSSALQNASKASDKTFAFTNSTNNIFGNLNASSSVPTTSKFSFTNANPTSGVQANNPPNANNIASSQQNTFSGTSDRPFRRATRRLQKS